MGAILGLGITHYPNLAGKANFAGVVDRALQDPKLPPHLADQNNWHPNMREQWGTDQGKGHAEDHRQQMIGEFRKARAELDAFNPDVVLIWGDDQYENYRDDCVPAFSLLAYDQVEMQPWKVERFGGNWWGEPAEKTFQVKGHRAAGRYLATELLYQGIDIAYAYRPLHTQSGLGHAFANSVLYLDFDRKGFDYPVLPFTVNAYGRILVGTKGVPPTPTTAAELFEAGQLDPPGPQPWRCFQVGQAVARAMQKSPWRVALVASSSWSHGFLTMKNGVMFPDVEADRKYFDALREGNWDLWRRTGIDEAEDSGHHELLNWFMLAGAMSELERKPNEATFLETWICNSDKVFAVFRP